MQAQRSQTLDALRGVALLWMTAFHACFDLAYFGWLHADFYRDALWTWQRTAILSLFLLCAGAGQALAAAAQQDGARWWRRWAQVAGAAALVSLGSWWMFPRSFIYFGVLHGMAVMLPLARWAARAALPTRTLVVFSGVAVASKYIAAYALSTSVAAPFAAWMNAPGPNLLGWVSRLPVTEDYVPIFPWLGVMALGLVLHARLSRGGWLARRCAGTRAWRTLVWMGRHSLGWYLLHQPVLIGLMLAAQTLRA